MGGVELPNGPLGSGGIGIVMIILTMISHWFAAFVPELTVFMSSLAFIWTLIWMLIAYLGEERSFRGKLFGTLAWLASIASIALVLMGGHSGWIIFLMPSLVSLVGIFALYRLRFEK